MEIASSVENRQGLDYVRWKAFLMNCVMDMNISCPAEGMSCLS